MLRPYPQFGDVRKIETTDGVIHIVLFHLTYDERVAPSELDIVLGPGYLLTVHEASWDPRDSNKLRSGIGPVLRHGPDHLLWALADDIVDGYFPFADRLGDDWKRQKDRVAQLDARRQAHEPGCHRNDHQCSFHKFLVI